MIRPDRIRPRLAAPVAAFAVFVLCLTVLPGAAALVQVDADLNDGLVPAGFTLSTTNNAGLANGRLQAVATNGSGRLFYGSLPGGLSQVDIGYRGHFGPSQWGTYTQIELAGVATLFHGYSNFNFPGVNRASVGTSSATNPANFSDFDYAITIVDGRIDFSGTDIATGIQEFSLTYTDAGIQLDNLTQIGFRAHNTTGTEPV